MPSSRDRSGRPRLGELQADFAAALVGGDEAALVGELVAGGAAPAARLAVYRASVAGNYRKALAAVYPVVERLVGERFFDHAAAAFARATPSRHGDLNRYGAEFAEFLAAFPGARELAYLADTARLEWAVEEVFHAADATASALEGLAGLAEVDYPALAFALAPACRLLESAWPVDRLWALNQPGAPWDDAFDIAAGGVRLLVRRSGFEVELERLGPGEFAFLAGLGRGERLGEACERALAAEPGVDVGAVLRRHLLAATLGLADGHGHLRRARARPAY